MIQLAELPHETLRAQLAGPGLNLRTGPFVNRVRSPLPDVVKGLRLVYADYTVSDPDDYADFHVALTPLYYCFSVSYTSFMCIYYFIVSLFSSQFKHT